MKNLFKAFIILGCTVSLSACSTQSKEGKKVNETQASSSISSQGTQRKENATEVNQSKDASYFEMDSSRQSALEDRIERKYKKAYGLDYEGNPTTKQVTELKTLEDIQQFLQEKYEMTFPNNQTKTGEYYFAFNLDYLYGLVMDDDYFSLYTEVYEKGEVEGYQEQVIALNQAAFRLLNQLDIDHYFRLVVEADEQSESFTEQQITDTLKTMKQKLADREDVVKEDARYLGIAYDTSSLSYKEQNPTQSIYDREKMGNDPYSQVFSDLGGWYQIMYVLTDKEITEKGTKLGQGKNLYEGFLK